MHDFQIFSVAAIKKSPSCASVQSCVLEALLTVCSLFQRHLKHTSTYFDSTYLHLRIPDMVKNQYTATRGASLKKLEETIDAEKEIAVALKGSLGQETAGADSSVASTSTTPTRTLAQPDFEAESRHNFKATKEFDDALSMEI